MTTPVAAAGLLTDIAGAILLLHAVLGRRPWKWIGKVEAPPGNPFMLLGAAREAADATVGASLLVVGFGGQFASAVGANPSWACLQFMLGAASALVVLSLMALPILRLGNIRAAIYCDLLDAERQDGAQRLENWSLVMHGEHFFGLISPLRRVYKAPNRGRREDEDVDAYGRRLLGEKRWLRLVNEHWEGLPENEPSSG